MKEPHPRIDAHHHVWDPTRATYPWMVGDALDPVRRPFTPDYFALELAAQRISGTVLVQTTSDLGRASDRGGRWYREPPGNGVGHAITVNVVEPAAKTDAADNIERANPEAMAAAVAAIPMGRLGDPHLDIAPAVLFLATDDARYITGQTVGLDGGSLLHA